MNNEQQETIVALATSPGPAGIAVIRLSGADSLAVLARFFVHKNGASVEGWPTHTVRYGWIRTKDGRMIDEVLVTVMRAPKSYTVQDVVEIGCHGGAVVAQDLIGLCVRYGARLAKPGEFTKRAYLNGRIDLSQAEAVMDVITARTQAALRAGTRLLKGKLSRELEELRESVMGALSGMEAFLNFPEDHSDEGQILKVMAQIDRVLERIVCLLGTARFGCVLRDGVRVVIAGKANVGKSSLLNAFLRHERAIVTDIAGTTRDALEETANIGGFPVNFVDTAGILEPRDAVEVQAVGRSYALIDGADIVLLVLDQSRPLEDADRDLITRTCGRCPRLIVLNKSDLPAAFDRKDITALLPECQVLALSLLTRRGFAELEQALALLASGGSVLTESAVVVTHARHVEALQGAKSSLERSRLALNQSVPPEIAAEEMKAAVRMFDRITGRDADIDLVDRIFNEFCIGK